MTVRRIGASDAAAMASLHAQCFDRPWSALDMAVHAGRDLCLGIKEPLASFAILRLSDVDAEVLTIATGPAQRGNGLAGLVLVKAEESCRTKGLRDIFLEVAEDNAPARALYKRLGYEPIGRRPAYYKRSRGRIAAITYRRILIDQS